MKPGATIVCRICGVERHRLAQHLKYDHDGLKQSEYLEMYPGADTLSDTARERLRQRPRNQRYSTEQRRQQGADRLYDHMLDSRPELGEPGESLVYWTRQRMLDAQAADTAERGYAPAVLDWKHPAGEPVGAELGGWSWTRDRHPSAMTVIKEFGSWRAFLEEGGNGEQVGRHRRPGRTR